MSSQSLAAARARRAGTNAPPVSGNRPITSIGSQAAFASPPPGMGYQMPHPPNNVRTARAAQPPPQANKPQPKKYQQYEQPQQQHQQQQHYQQQPASQNALPFSKLSISDAIGLITLRLGRIEQWVLDTENEEVCGGVKAVASSDIPANHTIIDNSVLTTIVHRLDALEKNGHASEDTKKWIDDVKTMMEQFKRMADDVSKHTIELSKNTEQVFRFNRELTETKDILKSFMVKYDMFATETTQNFADYEMALAELEKRLPKETDIVDALPTETKDDIGTSISDIDADNTDPIILTANLKHMIKQELGNI